MSEKNAKQKKAKSFAEAVFGGKIKRAALEIDAREDKIDEVVDRASGLTIKKGKKK